MKQAIFAMNPLFISPLEQSFPAWLETRPYSQIFILTDENTQQHCLPYFLSATGLTEKITATQIPSGETQKNLYTCQTIWQAMLEAQLDRKALVINLGGGVLGDMGGFCAATWKRGVDFIQIPTTLLSMTDAAIGGKTGIDFQGFKNIIGVFKQPAAVFIDPYFLQTLPERELRSGFAEVIKHALIGDPDVMAEQVTSSRLLSKLDWLNMLQKSIAVKVRIVQEDPLEKGLRMLLNFGHSIGHALESYFLQTDHPLTHGEAVYIGMLCEAEFSNPKRRLREAVLQLGESVFPHRIIPPQAFPEIWRLMEQDKKNSSGTVVMAVPDELPFALKLVTPNPSEVFESLERYNTIA